MMFEAIVFYVLAAVIAASALGVIMTRNAVHGALLLILAFFNGAGLFILLGAEFLAMILVVVYVGAVMVLFLFVVMMLDVDFQTLRQGARRYGPMGLLVAGILCLEIVVSLGSWVLLDERRVVHPSPEVSAVSNTDALGRIVYTDYVLLFQSAGMILLLAMVGAIVLTHRVRQGVKRQRIAEQTSLRRDQAVKVVDVQPGQGA